MKKTIQIVFQVIIALVLLVLLAMLITSGMILFRSIGSSGEFTHMIVLGTTVEGTEPSPMLEDRIQAAAKYMQKDPDVICIVTGGKADRENISEAQCMFNGLTDLGIEAERILLEDQATTTVENFQYSVALLEEELGSCPANVGILSSEFHLMRATMLAKHHGIENPIAIPAGTSDTEAFFTYFIREIFVVWYDGLGMLLS